MTMLYPRKSCSITDDWKYKGMQVVFLENELLKIGILADRGSDIFEFTYKPLNLDFLLRLQKDIDNPASAFSQIRDTSNQFEDYYYGGWQEILPNSKGFNYRGAMLGQHGEVSLIPWKYAVIEDSPEVVSVKLWTQPLRMPLRIQKTLSLKKGEPTLYIEEELTNDAPTDLQIMWGHHIAFGLPFLQEGVVVETNARTFSAESGMPEPGRFKPGVEFKWPEGEKPDGTFGGADLIEGVEGASYSELCYIKGHARQAFYTITNPCTKTGFRLDWDGDLFKCLWLWQERCNIKDFPWWGNCYAVALEPWTSAFVNDPDRAVANRELLSIKGGQTIQTGLKASVFNG